VGARSATDTLKPADSDMSGMIEPPRGGYAIAANSPGLDQPLAVSIVVPTYNESKGVGEIVARLAAILETELPGRYEIIVVDDDSPDRTWAAAAALVSTYPALKVMRRVGERGLSSAVIRGWQAARGEVLGVIDADLQHPPEALLKLWGEMQRGAEMAVASRHVEGGGVSEWSMLRRIVSRGAQVIGLLILPDVVGRVADPMSGYFLVRRSVLSGVQLHPMGYKILIEVLGRARVRWISEVPYVFKERELGESKVTRKVYFDYLRHLLTLRWAKIPLTRFMRFALVGLSGVVVDMTFLFLLSDPSMLAWGLTRSKLIAAELAIVNNFFWNDVWTFRDRANDRRPQSRLRRFAKFQVICLMGVIINTVLLNVLFNFFGMNRYVANAVAIAVVTGWNYWLNLKISWRAKQPD
jgi:dolichol-phosphate mannosyltransferase